MRAQSQAQGYARGLQRRKSSFFARGRLSGNCPNTVISSAGAITRLSTRALPQLQIQCDHYLLFEAKEFYHRIPSQSDTQSHAPCWYGAIHLRAIGNTRTLENRGLPMNPSR